MSDWIDTIQWGGQSNNISKSIKPTDQNSYKAVKLNAKGIWMFGLIESQIDG